MLGWIKRLFGGGEPVVGVVRMTGPIGAGGRFRPGVSFSGIASEIEQAFSLGGLKAVALVINSPGGSPVQSALIMNRVRALAKEKDVPVLAFAEDVMASGGYLLALGGDEIFVQEASLVGSIGVVAGSFGFSEAIGKLGVERRLYTAGENKARLDPFSPESADDVAWLKNLQSQVHDYFIALVEDRRGKRLNRKEDDLFTGDVWLGKRAVELGLADGIGDARSVLRERFGKKVRLRTISKKKGLLAMISSRTGVPDLDSLAAGGWADDLLAAAETRLMWSRWGL